MAYFFSLITRLVVELDRRLSRPTHLPGFVMSIGNLTWGGTGKTPVIIKCANDFIQNGKKTAILTRGYKGFLQGSGDSDEVRLMRQKCPDVAIGVGSNRVKSYQSIKGNTAPDCVLLDDGFQHWSLKRDLDIVCIDASNPWGNGWLIPFGPLREPLSALARAHVVFLTRCDLVEGDKINSIERQILQNNPKIEIFHSSFKTQLWNVYKKKEVSFQALSGRNILALSALGNPSGFEGLLQKAGLKVTPLRYRDHHIYSEKDLKFIESKLSEIDGVLVTTEKDWMKLQETSLNIILLRIGFQFLMEDAARWDKFLKRRIDETQVLH